jgi:hypothetical protein
MEKQQRSTQHFTFVSKVKPGRGKNIRANASKRAEIPWEEIDKLLRPLTLHYARWILFNNDTQFIYYASFDTDLDRYLDDAARIFAESGVAGFFPDLEGFPDDPASAGDPEAYRKFLADNAVESFYQFEGYPGVTVEEVKKGLRVRNAFSSMLDEMQ